MLNIYAIYDAKAEAYLQPFFTTADGLAIRMFQQSVNDQEHTFNKWADDYTLFSIGRWDEITGTMHSSEVNISLGNALTYKETQETNGFARPVDGSNPPVRWESPPRIADSE